MKWTIIIPVVILAILPFTLFAASPPDPPLFDSNELDYTLFTGPRTVPVTMYYDPSHELWAVPDSLIEAAILEWNQVTPNFKYIYGGRLTPGTAYGNNNCGNVGPNNVNSISWWQIAGNQVLGRSCVWQLAGSEECDIELATDQNVSSYLTNPEYFRTILLHESGHCLGLGHSADSTAVMYAALTHPNHIQADDANGVCALYGGPCTVPTTPTPTPTSTNTPMPTSTPTITPTRTPTTKPPSFHQVVPNVARD